jgi:hypothetical protein
MFLFSGIIFVAIMKQHILKDHLFRFQWIGVFYNVLSVFMVGSTAILSESKKETDESGSAGTALLGVLLVMMGALVQAMVSEFWLMSRSMPGHVPHPVRLVL